MSAAIDEIIFTAPVATMFDLMVLVVVGASIGTCLAIFALPALAFLVNFVAAFITPSK